MASGTIKAVVGRSDIVNNLTTNDSTKVLSAAQGKALKDAADTLNTNIRNNYKDYNSTGEYHIRVCEMGKIVVVSGVIFGTGQAEYLNNVNLPTPAYYTNGSTENIANAVIFNARNQTTGAIQQMRVGGDFKIYLEAAMTLDQPYAFGFSYCKA